MHYKWWSLNTRALQLTATTNSRRHIADAAAVNWKNNSVTTPCPSAERRGKAGHTVEAIWLSTKHNVHITFNLNILKCISKTLEKCRKVNISSCRSDDRTRHELRTAQRFVLVFSRYLILVDARVGLNWLWSHGNKIIHSCTVNR